MAHPKPLDIARTTEEHSPATKEDIAKGLGVEVGAPQFEKAFGNADQRGLIERETSGGEDRWKVSQKGRRRLGS